jgi:RNA polymerase sigma factor (sigma-70 family)
MISTTMEERAVAKREASRPRTLSVSRSDECLAKLGAASEAPETRYVYHPSFALPGAEEKYWGQQAEPIEVPHYELPPEVLEDPPAPCHRGPSLTADRERTLFLRYNYAKYRLRQAIEARGSGRGRAAETVRLWRARAEESRSKIVHANLALVVAMAKRMQDSCVEFTELISEGNLAVLRSVEKFDAARGFKFSTYACRSILTCFHRLASKARRQRERFPVEFDTRMEKSDHGERRHEEQRDYAIETVRRLVRDNRADLSAMEHQVILERFPMLTGGKARTLAQVGEIVGLTNERVRQIEKKSLGKIRAALEVYFAA